jgi:hypothetical protein
VVVVGRVGVDRVVVLNGGRVVSQTVVVGALVTVVTVVTAVGDGGAAEGLGLGMVEDGSSDSCGTADDSTGGVTLVGVPVGLFTEVNANTAATTIPTKATAVAAVTPTTNPGRVYQRLRAAT